MTDMLGFIINEVPTMQCINAFKPYKNTQARTVSVMLCFVNSLRNLGRVKRICVFEHSVMTNLTAHAQPSREARDLAFYLKVQLDSLLVRTSSEGSGETALMRRLA